MAYSKKVKRLLLYMCRSRSAEEVVTLVSGLLGMGRDRGFASLAQIAEAAPLVLTDAEWLELQAKVPEPRTIRAWLSKEKTEPTTDKATATPRLSMAQPRVEVHSDGIAVARYAVTDVANSSVVEATDCSAWVEVLDRGLVLPLHFAGTQETASEADAPKIAISRLKPARLEIAFTLPPPGQSPTGPLPDVKTSGDVPMYLPGPWIPPWNGEGCWLAQPLALHSPSPSLESFLPPGEYRIHVTVTCPGGVTAAGAFTLVSPTSWDGLQIGPS